MENRVVKSLVLDKFGENMLFSCSPDRSKSSLIYWKYTIGGSKKQSLSIVVILFCVFIIRHRLLIV